ncbi:cytochrome P450 [Sorangium sp. So ce1151]|uniref:cytochrome P450 n=1 Tax=Sorangium sp. So ce1151 TaxID=3133332 RepID=UPI003F6013CC
MTQQTRPKSVTPSSSRPTEPADALREAGSLPERYHPFVSPQLDDPYPVYALARRHLPVFFSQVLGMWVVTRYDDICAVLRDTATFSSLNMLTSPYRPAPEAIRVLQDGGYERARLTVDNDPPAHTRVRSAVNKALTPARAARLEAGMYAVADRLVDAFERDGRAELLGQFAFSLPAMVMLDFLGLPQEDAGRLLGWVEAWAGFMWAPLTPEQQVQSARAMVEYHRYCVGQVEARKAAPRDDLLSELIRGQSEGAAGLSDLEIAGMVNDLLFAGQKSTAYAIANAVRLLLGHPEQWAAVREDPGLLSAAVEETLRMDSSAQAMTRTATREALIAGVAVPEGASICLVVGSANHDETHASDPERFDIRRKLDKHLAFGHGIHYCVGAGLARAEVRVALDVLGRRLRGLRLVPDQAITYAPSLILRGPTRLEIAWDPSPVMGASGAQPDSQAPNAS